MTEKSVAPLPPPQARTPHINVSKLAEEAAMEFAKVTAMVRGFMGHPAPNATMIAELARIIERKFEALAESAPQEAPKCVKENGAFTKEVIEQVLIPSTCGVAGHFKFQLNGGHCMMCQREQQLIKAAIEKAAPQEAGTISLSDAAKIGRKTWQEKYGDCSMCTAGDRPEWAPYAKCFIHRHDKLDRRCGNNPPAERGVPLEETKK